MQWCSLPVAGGLYDQHPKLVAQWQILFREKSEWEKIENDRRERESKRKK